MSHRIPLVIVLLISSAVVARAEDWHFKQQLLPLLAEKVPDILKSQDPKTGRFGSGVFIVRDQEPMLALAVAWATQGEGNPYFHSDQVLQAIIKAGDALIAAQKPNGMFLFKKKDGSEWGDIYMPWTYSRWVRTFALIRDAMPADARDRWSKALILGYSGIQEHELVKAVQNIPAHDAMGLYQAGKVFDRRDWCDAARAYMKRVVDAQYPDGYWTENVAPVINYGFVYVEAVGTYYAMSHDPDVLAALQRAAQFHSAFVYPDGRPVEVVDERNPYEATALVPGAGFTFCDVGRSWAKARMDQRLRDGSIGADMLASYILYGQEGPVESVNASSAKTFITQDGKAATYRNGPWFACMASYHAEVKNVRWIQDLQNFFSVYRDGCHVIIGGGNTKLQPLWSTFTVGDVNLLKHTPGDENPNFVPPPGILHVPSDAKLDAEHQTVELTYGDVKCSATVDISDPKQATVMYALLTPTEKHVEAHVTLVPEMKAAWQTASGKHGKLSAEPIHLAPSEAGDWFELGNWRITVPPQATISWPVLPHNPYTKDGRAEPREGRIVMTLPLDQNVMKYKLEIKSSD